MTLYSKQSTGQTAPVVDCGSDTPSQALPDYPKYSGDDDAYRKAQAAWAIQAAGAYQSEKILRSKTASCLDDLRAKGIIN